MVVGHHGVQQHAAHMSADLYGQRSKLARLEDVRRPRRNTMRSRATNLLPTKSSPTDGRGRCRRDLAELPRSQQLPRDEMPGRRRDPVRALPMVPSGSGKMRGRRGGLRSHRRWRFPHVARSGRRGACRQIGAARHCWHISSGREAVAGAPESLARRY